MKCFFLLCLWQTYGGLSAGEFQLIRQTLLTFFQDLHIRVSEWVAPGAPCHCCPRETGCQGARQKTPEVAQVVVSSALGSMMIKLPITNLSSFQMDQGRQ